MYFFFGSTWDVGKLDQTLIRSLGISVSQIASAMEKSRQTVNRGIHAEAEYFKAASLGKALSLWRVSEPNLYALAKQKVYEIYPFDIVQSVLAAAGIICSLS